MLMKKFDMVDRNDMHYKKQANDLLKNYYLSLETNPKIVCKYYVIFCLTKQQYS